MTWIIEFDSKARKEFKKLSKDVQKEIQHFLRKKLINTSDPTEFGKPLMHEKSGLWRYRVGKYRLICSIEGEKLIIYVIRIAKRDKVYK